MQLEEGAQGPISNSRDPPDPLTSIAGLVVMMALRNVEVFWQVYNVDSQTHAEIMSNLRLYKVSMHFAFRILNSGQVKII